MDDIEFLDQLYGSSKTNNQYEIDSPYSVIPDKPKKDYEESKAYLDKLKYERKNKVDLLTQNPYAPISHKQYKDPKTYQDTGPYERGLNWLDDKYDEVTDFIFGKDTPKTAKEKKEAQEDNNIEVWNGQRVKTKNKIRNDLDINELQSMFYNLEEEEDAKDILYIGRVDNPDGSVSYKYGTTSIDPYSRTKDFKREKDLTYLYAIRNSKAKEIEALIHGNSNMLKSRRFDLGRDKEKYGSGYTEIYNKDLFDLDGTVTTDKLRTLNMSSIEKGRELGFKSQNRYDNMEMDLKHLDKLGSIYGKNSKEYKEAYTTFNNIQQIDRIKTRGVFGTAGDLIDAVQSGSQQTIAGFGDAVLDATVAGNSTLLDNAKNPEVADKAWGYTGRKEANRLGELALREWDKGNYAGALIKGIQASPDTVAQSIPDMLLMFYSGGLGALSKAEKVARFSGLLNSVKSLSQVSKNRGLLAYAAKQTNNQIDDRLANGVEGDDVGLGTIAGMLASNYVLGGIDKLAFKSNINTDKIKELLISLPENKVVDIAKKAAGVTASILKESGVEAAQEYIQTYGETINSALGTEKYGDDPFSQYFLDEATKGALLGAGAGGLTHSTVLGGEALLGELSEAERKTKIDEEKPFSTDSSFKDTSNYQNSEEIYDTVKPKDSNEYLKSFNQEVEDLESGNIDNYEEKITVLEAILSDKNAKDRLGVDDTTLDSLKAKVDTLKHPYINQFKLATNKEGNSFKRKEATSRSISLINNAGKHLSNLISNTKKAIDNGELDQESLEFMLEESLSDVEDKTNISIFLNALNHNKYDNSTIEKLAKKDTKDIDEKAEFYNNTERFSSLKDVVENIGENDTNSNILNTIQKMLLIGKKSRYNTKGEEELVNTVAEYLGSVKDKYLKSNRLTDAIVGSTFGEPIIKASKAFNNMNNEQIEEFVRIQNSLLEAPFITEENRYGKDKTMYNVSHDIFVGDDLSEDMSLQDYMDNVLKAMAFSDEENRNTLLSKLVSKGNAFLESRNEAYKNINQGFLKKIAVEETAYIKDVVDYITSLISENNKEDLKVKSKDTSTNKEEETSNKEEKDTSTEEETDNKKKEEDKDTSTNKEEEAKKEKQKKMDLDRLLSNIRSAAQNLKENSETKRLENMLLEMFKLSSENYTMLTNSLKGYESIDQEVFKEVVDRVNSKIELSKAKSKLLDELDNTSISDNKKSNISHILSNVTNINLDIEYVFDMNANALQGISTDDITELMPEDDIAYSEDNLDSAISFYNTMFNRLKTIFTSDKFNILDTNKLLTTSPSLALLLKDRSKDELLSVLTYVTSDSIASLTNSLVGNIEEGFNKNIGKTIGLDFATNAQKIELHRLGMPRTQLVNRIKSGIEKLIKIEGNSIEIEMNTIDGTKKISLDSGEETSNILSQELALLVVAGLNQLGYIETNTFTKEDIDAPIPFVRFGKDAFSKFLRASNSNKYKEYFDTLFTGKTEEKGFYTVDDELPKTQTKLKNGQPVGKGASRALESVKSTYYVLNKDVEVLTSLNSKELLDLLNIDPKLVHPMGLSSIGLDLDKINELYNTKGLKYNELVNTYKKNLNSHRILTAGAKLSYAGKINKKLLTIKTIQQLKNYPNKYIHTDGKIGSNGRLYLNSYGTENLQSDTFLRFLLTSQNSKQVIDLTNKEELDLFKLDLMTGLAQFTDDYYGEDKSTPNTSIEKFESTISKLASDSNLKALIKAISEGTTTSKDIYNLGKLVDMTNSHTLSSLISAYSYIEAVETNKPTFVADVSSEVDGKNSAVGFSTIQNGDISNSETSSILLSVGVMTRPALEELSKKLEGEQKELVDSMLESGTGSVEELVEAGIDILDAYQAITADFIAETSKSMPTFLRFLELLYGGSFIDSNTGEVTSAGRNFAKGPLMRHMYEQQKEGLSYTLSKDLVEDIQNMFMDKTKTKEELDDRLENLMDLLNKANDETTDTLDIEDKRFTTLTGMSAEYRFDEEGDIDLEATYDNITNLIGELAGTALYDVIKAKFTKLKHNKDAALEAYDLIFIFRETIKDVLKNTNEYSNTKAFEREVTKELNEKLSFKIGDKNIQELVISETEIDPAIYDEGKGELSLLEGGNRIVVPFKDQEGKSHTISSRFNSYRQKKKGSAMFPLDTHLRDFSAIAYIIEFVKVNQIYDAIVGAGRVRLTAEILANIGFYEQTLKQEHLVDYAIHSVSRALTVIKSLDLNDEAVQQLDTSFSKILKTYGYKKGKVDSGSISLKLEKVKTTLEKESKTVKENKQKLLDSLINISQYGVNSRLVFKEGNLIGIHTAYNDKLETSLDGKSIKDLSIAVLKNEVVKYYLGNSSSTKAKDTLIKEAKEGTSSSIRTQLNDLAKTSKEQSTKVIKDNVASILEDEHSDSDSYIKVTKSSKENNQAHTIIENNTYDVITEKLEQIQKEQEIIDKIEKDEKAEIKKEILNNVGKKEVEEEDTLDDDEIDFNDYEMEEEEDLLFSIGETLDKESITKFKTINSSNVVETFNEVSNISSKPNEMPYLSHIVNSIIQPIIDTILFKEYTADSSYSIGAISTTTNGSPDIITMEHPVAYNGIDQSSAEVFVHELIHSTLKPLFHKTRIKNSFSKELSIIKDLYNKVGEIADSSWFGEGQTAKHQYNHIFNNEDKNIGIHEFTTYLMSNIEFAKRVDKEIGKIEVNIFEPVNTKGVVSKIINTIVNILNKLFSKKGKVATETVKDIILEINNIHTSKKKLLFRPMYNAIEKVKILDSHLRQGKLPFKGRITKLINNINLVKEAKEHIPTTGVDNIEDKNDLSALILDLLPSSNKSTPYVEHGIKARSFITRARDLVVKRVMHSILGKNDIPYQTDNNLYKYILQTDLYALYNIKGITVEDIHKATTDIEYRYELIGKLKTRLLNNHKFKDEHIKYLFNDIKDLALGAIDRLSNNPNSTSIIKNAGTIAYKYTRKSGKEVSNSKLLEIENLIDALASLEVLKGLEDHSIDIIGELLNNNSEVITGMFKEVYTAQEIIKKHLSMDRYSYLIKGEYSPVTDNLSYIVPIVESDKKVPSNFILLESIKIGDKTLSYYKVEESVMQSRVEGSIGIIDYFNRNSTSLFDNLSKEERRKIIVDLDNTDTSYKSEKFIYSYDTKGYVTDIKVKVPQYLINSHLNIDTRASVTLAHTLGAIEEHTKAKKYNKEWVDLANKDFIDNYYKHPEEFIYIGENSNNKEYRKHYNILPNYLKYWINNSDMSSGKGGMWVRKSLIRYTFGGDVKSIIDILNHYGIDKPKLNKVIRGVERMLVEISTLFKIEVVGKMYQVIFGNIVSNILLEMLKGRNPITIMKYMLEGIIAIDSYNQIEKDIVELKLAIDSTRNLSQKTALTNKLSRLEKKLENSPVKYLVDLGFNSSFVEDTMSDNSMYKDKKVQKVIDKINSSKGLKLGKQVFDELYMTTNTTSNQIFKRIVIASDIGSRYATDQLDAKYIEEDIKRDFKVRYPKVDSKTRNVLFKNYRAKRLKEFEKERVRYLQEQHIDYSTKSGDWLTSLDKLGITPFFKFKQRIAKVLYKRYSDNPLTALIIGNMLMFIDNTLVDIERPEESFFPLISDTSGSPIDHLIEIVESPLVRNFMG